MIEWFFILGLLSNSFISLWSCVDSEDLLSVDALSILSGPLEYGKSFWNQLTFVMNFISFSFYLKGTSAIHFPNACSSEGELALSQQHGSKPRPLKEVIEVRALTCHLLPARMCLSSMFKFNTHLELRPGQCSLWYCIPGGSWMNDCAKSPSPLHLAPHIQFWQCWHFWKIVIIARMWARDKGWNHHVSYPAEPSLL